jgi:hypothetical protein
VKTLVVAAGYAATSCRGRTRQHLARANRLDVERGAPHVVSRSARVVSRVIEPVPGGCGLASLLPGADQYSRTGSEEWEVSPQGVPLQYQNDHLHGLISAGANIETKQFPGPDGFLRVL